MEQKLEREQKVKSRESVSCSTRPLSTELVDRHLGQAARLQAGNHFLYSILSINLFQESIWPTKQIRFANSPRYLGLIHGFDLRHQR